MFQRLPLANLFNDGVTSSIRPTVIFDSRDNQLFPASGIFLQGSAEFASQYLGSHNEFIRYRATGRFYYPVNTSKSVVIKLNTEAGLVTSPSSAGVPIFARFFLGGILDLRGFPLRSIGPRLPLKSALDPNSAPIANGANIGGNLMYYQNLELEFPIIEAVQIRGVIFTDLGNAWNLEQLYCNAAPASPVRRHQPLLHRGQHLQRAHLVGLRHPLVLAARPAPLRVGLPLQAAPLRAIQRLPVHHRQLLLMGAPPPCPRPRGGGFAPQYS